MQYTVHQLARLAGISTRALRHYDHVGLLRPERIASSGYRIYGSREVERLQQILFYKELDMPLSEIQRLLDDPGYDVAEALGTHVRQLQDRQARLGQLIQNAQNTIMNLRGDKAMSDQERFEGFKQAQLQDNETRYGTEIREKYGKDAVEQSNAKWMGMSESDFKQFEALGSRLNQMLKEAVLTGDPGSEPAQRAAALHREWLMFTWPHYTPEAHMGVAQMYVDDPRFTAYYDEIVPGCAVFLRDAVQIFCQNA